MVLDKRTILLSLIMVSCATSNPLMRIKFQSETQILKAIREDFYSHDPKRASLYNDTVVVMDDSIKKISFIPKNYYNKDKTFNYSYAYHYNFYTYIVKHMYKDND